MKITEAFKRIQTGFTKAMAAAVEAFRLHAVRMGWRHPVRSMQVVLDYPKPGPRRSRFTGIAAMRREARRQRNRRAARV